MSFSSFDWDSDAAWTSYRRNVEIMDTSEAALTRLKAKWYKKNVDPTFTIPSPAAAPEATATATGRAAPSSYRPPAGAMPTSTSASSQPAASTRPVYQSPVPPAAPRPPATRAEQLKRSVQTHVLAALHLTMLVLAVLYPASFFVRRSASAQLFRLFMQVALATHLYKVVVAFKFPPLYPFNFAALKEWLGSVMNSSDSHYAIIAVIFLSQMPFPPVMISPTVLAAYHFAAYTKQQFGTTSLWARIMEPLYQQMLARQGDALQLCALVDVASAFAITAMIVFHRSIFLPFVYINQLRTRYKSADSRDRHQAAWRTIGTYVNPLIEKVPALEMPVGYAKNWFTSA